MRILVLCVILGNLPGLCTGKIYANPSAKNLNESVKGAIKRLPAPLMGPVSKNDVNAIQAVIDKTVSDATKEGKPIRFGIGILDRDGVAVAGRYVVGDFKVDDFSNYRFVAKAYKAKRIVQDRLYFQDGSEFFIVCIPLVQQKDVIGAIVLGFKPSEVRENYGLNTEQLLALDFKK